jgi:hypothetical protein
MTAYIFIGLSGFIGFSRTCRGLAVALFFEKSLFPVGF